MATKAKRSKTAQPANSTALAVVKQPPSIIVDQVTSAFDFESIVDSEDRQKLIDIAIEVREDVANDKASIIRRGNRLRWAQDKLGRGPFCKYVVKCMGEELRSAYNYMAASEYAEHDLETVSKLKISTIYKLAKKTTPPKLRQEVRERLAAGEQVDEKELLKSIRVATASTKPTKPASKVDDKDSYIEQLEQRVLEAEEERDIAREERDDESPAPLILKLIQVTKSVSSANAVNLLSENDRHRLNPNEILELADWLEDFSKRLRRTPAEAEHEVAA